LVHRANNIWTIEGKKKPTTKQVKLLNFEKRPLSKLSTLKMVIQTSFVTEGFHSY